MTAEEQAREMLDVAAKQFREYQAHHTMKGDDRKSQVNAAFAERCEEAAAALRAQPPASPSPLDDAALVEGISCVIQDIPLRRPSAATLGATAYAKADVAENIARAVLRYLSAAKPAKET